MTCEMGDDNFFNTIANLLQLGNTVNALNLFTDNKNSQEVYNNSWDFIPLISSYLTKENQFDNIEVFKTCEQMLNYLSEQSKPEEVLLQLIEEIEAAKDDVKFVMLLKPVQKVFIRLPNKRITSLAWCFNSIKAYLTQINTPDGLVYTEEERLLLDSDNDVIRILHLYDELDLLCEYFVQEIDNVANITDMMTQRRLIIAKFIIELLGAPFACLDLQIYNETKPKARRIAESLIAKCSKVVSDPFTYLTMRNEAEYGELFKPNNLSLGVFFYILLSEKFPFPLPKVYNPTYIFYHMYQILTDLLNHTNQFVIEKGIALSETLLANICPNSLPYYLLDSKHQSKFCVGLSNVIVHNQAEETRKKGLNILKTYLWAFGQQGSYNIIWHLLGSVTHSGLKGFIITQYKEMFAKELRTNCDLNVYYGGKKLFDLLNVFTRLKDKEESDLVDESDQIVSTLNFLLYLLLADAENKSKIADYIPKLQNEYFDYLRRGIELSKEHYNLKIKQLNEGGDKKLDFETSVTVGNSNLFEMSDDKKIEVLQLSLTTLEVIDSLLCHVLSKIE